MDLSNAIFFADLMTEREGISWSGVNAANSSREPGGYRVGTQETLKGYWSDCPVVHTGRGFLNG